jgi:glycosyltransferase involved in cell wall biosynthesis
VRILHIITMLEIGGAQYNTLLSAADSLRRGHDVRVAASPGPLVGEARHLLGECFIALSALRREISPWHDLAAFFALRQLIRSFRPEIVHTHSSKAGILGRWAARSLGVPRIIHTAHGWGFHRGQRPLVRRVYQFIERITARITDRLIVVSEANRREALAAGIGRPEQYVLIRSGIAPVGSALSEGREAAAPPTAPTRMDKECRSLDQRSVGIRVAPIADCHATSAAVRREFGIPEDAFLLLAVGNYKPQKNPAAMARIAATLLAARPNAFFLSIGDGPDRSRLETTLAPWLGSRAILPGWRDDPRRLMIAADLLLHTPLFEGLPRVILEALSAGLPVLSTDVDGIPEAVPNDVAGLLFPPEDEAGMIEALMRLHDDAALRTRLASGAREAFTREFTLDEMFERLEREYTASSPE